MGMGERIECVHVYHASLSMCRDMQKIVKEERRERG